MAAITTLPCLSEFFTSAETCSCTFGSSTPMAVGLPPSDSQLLALARATVPLLSKSVLPKSARTGAPTVFADFGLISEGNALLNDSPACDSRTRSCGRLGPARLGLPGSRWGGGGQYITVSGVFQVG